MVCSSDWNKSNMKLGAFVANVIALVVDACECNGR
jgi:hypothetical protein